MDIEKIKKFASAHHKNKYDGLPYSFHLEMTVSFAIKYLYLIPKEDAEIVIASCWLHDIIEDCQVSKNEIVKVSDVRVADIVVALSKKKNQSILTYYRTIANTPLASFVKICDRFANLSYSREKKNYKMLSKYYDEMPVFVNVLYEPVYEIMIQDIKKI